MKSLITTIAIIAGLILLFIVIDRSIYYSPPIGNGLNVVVQDRNKRESEPAATACRPHHDTTGLSGASKTSLGEKAPAETLHLEKMPPTETNVYCWSESSEFLQSHSEDKPFAVPVLTPEETVELIEQMKKEREAERERGYIFYNDSFSSVQYASSSLTNIQQTTNWRFVFRDEPANPTSIARKDKDYFVVSSATPVKYTFVEPLYENTMYCYTLCCNAKGDGVINITLSQNDGNVHKSFPINSKTFENVVYPLGDGSSLDTGIVPSVEFLGELQVESITLYQKKINEHRTICLGSIESISNVPDIKKSNYPDCYYTAKLVVKDILDGNPAPQKIQLLIPAFLNNKIDPLSKLMKKGNWKVSIRPFSLASEAEQEIEQVDEIESFLLTPYILEAASSASIPELTVSGIPILEGESYVSPFDNPVNPPLPVQFAEDSKREIKNELAKVNSILEQVKDEEAINAEFQLAWDEKQKQYDSLDSTRIWANEHNSFFALPKKWDFIPSAKITNDNVDAIVELDRLFKANGIQFIIQIVPDYRDIAALVLNPDFQKYGDQRSARVAKELLERGVEVQYISDVMVKNAFNYERLFFYPGDFHPDEGTTDIMTTLMSQRFEMFGDLLPKDLDSELFSKEKRDTGYKDSLKWPKNVDIGSHEAGSNVQVPYVLYNNKVTAQPGTS